MVMEYAGDLSWTWLLTLAPVGIAPLIGASLIDTIGGFIGGLFSDDPPEQQQRKSFNGIGNAQNQVNFLTEALRAALQDSITQQQTPAEFGGAPDPTALLQQLGNFSPGQVGIAPGVAEFGKPIQFLPQQSDALANLFRGGGSGGGQGSHPEEGNRGAVGIDFQRGQDTGGGPGGFGPPTEGPQISGQVAAQLQQDDALSQGQSVTPTPQASLANAAAGPNGAASPNDQQMQVSQQIDGLIQSIMENGRLV